MGIRVFVVDRERTFTDALAMRLEAEPDIDVVGTISAKSPAHLLLARGQADVVLIDGDFAAGLISQICADICARDNAPEVVVLGASSDPERIAAALRSGAAAWVRKDGSLSHLLRVIRGVVDGETWLPPKATRSVLRLLMLDQDQKRKDVQMLASLTPREREVLARLAEGASRQDVAEMLQLSAHTIRTHLQNLMAKLGVHSALEAVALTRSELTEVNTSLDLNRGTDLCHTNNG
jgi:DNA-binding NarL/FixJ family response regulator